MPTGFAIPYFKANDAGLPNKLKPAPITAPSAPNLNLFLNRAAAKQQLKDYQGAIADYTKVLEIDPQYAEVYNERGVVKNEIKDYQGAIDDFTKALEINPQDAFIYFDNRAGVKVETGDFRGVIFDATKTIQINPNYATAYTRRGIAKQHIGDKRGACADYKKAVSLGDQSSAQYLKSKDGTWCRNLR